MRHFSSLAVVILVVGCGQSQQVSCPVKLEGLGAHRINLAEAQRVEPSAKEAEIAHAVIRCNSDFKYAGQINPLRIEYSFELPNGHRLLILGMQFVADVKVVLDFDQSERLTRTYITGF